MSQDRAQKPLMEIHPSDVFRSLW